MSMWVGGLSQAQEVGGWLCFFAQLKCLTSGKNPLSPNYILGSEMSFKIFFFSEMTMLERSMEETR